MRRLVLPISLLVLLCSCGKKEPTALEAKPGEVPKSEVTPYTPRAAPPDPVPCSEAPPVEALPADAPHLGDGVTSDNYYFIVEELQRRPGSLKQTRDIERRQAEAQESSGTAVLKPPSANVVESEFSHLLGEVAENKGALGAAVFDQYGLKIGASGLQVEGMVQAKLRPEDLAAVGASDAAHVLRYTCEQLRELAKSCDAKATQGISCWDLQSLTNGCKGYIAAYYRPVLDDKDKPLGVSMLVMQEKRPCPEAIQEW